MAREPLPKNQNLLALMAGELMEYLKRLDRGLEACYALDVWFTAWRMEKGSLRDDPRWKGPPGGGAPWRDAAFDLWCQDVRDAGHGGEFDALYMMTIEESTRPAPYLSGPHLEHSWDRPDPVRGREAKLSPLHWHQMHDAARALLGEVRAAIVAADEGARWSPPCSEAKIIQFCSDESIQYSRKGEGRKGAVERLRSANLIELHLDSKKGKYIIRWVDPELNRRFLGSLRGDVPS